VFFVALLADESAVRELTSDIARLARLDCGAVIATAADDDGQA
jgi:hypothetical protein